MNRVIKFRAFFRDYGDPEKPSGTMFYDIIPCAADFTEWLISFDADGTYDGDFVVGKDIEIMQFTGLLDKNGKEVYEGDIVQVFYDKSEQREEDKAYTVVIRDMMQDRFTGVGEGRGEVIGNIYENPELLLDETK